jgi:hypothetical protein
MGKPGTIRSVQIQFRTDFQHEQTQRVKVVFGKARARNVDRFVPVVETLVAEDWAQGSKSACCAPGEVGCAIRGWQDRRCRPPIPDHRLITTGGWRRIFLDRSPTSPVRCSITGSSIALPVGTKMYVRTGERKYLEAAYEAAHFVRINTQPDGPNAGMFLVKKGPPDLKYVYPGRCISTIC